MFEVWVCAEELSLDVRSWACPICGAVHDRDVNGHKHSQGWASTLGEKE